MHLGGVHEGPDLGADGRQLGRIHRGDVGVLVEQLFQLGDVAVRLGPRHGRHEVVDDRRVRTSLGLRALARVVDEERVDEREVADRGVGRARRREGRVLAGQPLHRTVLAEVDDGMGAETLLDPAVRGEVVVRRRQVGVVVDRDRVLAEAARGLDEHHHVAGLQRGEHDLVLVVDEQAAGRRAPRLDHTVHELGREVRGPVAVVVSTDADVAVGQLSRGEPFLVLAAGGDQGVDEGIARLGVASVMAWHLEEAGHLSVRGSEVVALVAHAAEQADGRHRGVESDGVADPAVLRRVRRQHQRDLAVARWDVAEPRVVDGDARHPGTALGIGHVAREPVLVDLLERERRGDDASVELGDGDLVGRVERGHTLVGGLPLLAARRQAQALQDRDVERLHPFDVPRLVVAARTRRARGRAACGQHRDDEGVEVAERLVEVVGRRAQRRAVDRDTDGVAGRVDRVRQRVRERAVAARLVRPVVQDTDPRQPRRRDLAIGPSPGRQHRGRLEALAGEQDGVGEEGVQVREVGRPTLRQIAVRLGSGADRHRGVAHQLGVGRLLATQDDHRWAGSEHDIEPVLPRPHRPEQPHHDEVGIGDDGRQRVRDVEARRVGQRVVGSRGTSREEVGVGRRQQRDARHGFLRFAAAKD